MTVSQPDIEFIGTNGNNCSPYGHPTLAVVCHIMEGSLSSCDAWFANPASQASANYGIGKDGTIHCYVDPFAAFPYWAWANGVLNYPDATVQALVARGRALYGNVSPNVYTVSIEHEGYSGEPVAPAMFDASTQLTAYLCQEFAVPADRSSLLGHYQFDAVNRPGCPGWSHDTWTRYVGAVTDLLYPPAPPVDPAADERKYAADAQERLYRAQANVAAALESLALPPPPAPEDEIRKYMADAQARVRIAQDDLAAANESLNL
jgi:hypothetical protein